MDPSAPGFRVTAVTLSFTALAGLAVILRLFTRLVMVRKGGLEDVLIALSAVCISHQSISGLLLLLTHRRHWQLALLFKQLFK